MAAFDPFEQLRPQPLDPVAAHVPADCLIFPVEIILEERIAERANCECRALGRRPDSLAILRDHRCRMETMGAAGERTELRQRIVARLRLAENRAVVALENL